MNDNENEMSSEAQKTAETLSGFVNCYGNSVRDLVKVLSGEHRTIQQGITKFCVAWLEECNRKHNAGNFDLRNEASCQLGKAFVERTEPRERAMPFI